MNEDRFTDGQSTGVVADASPTDRRGFLKRLGLTLAAGIGVAGVLASSAFADPGQCCVVANDEDCSETGCGSCSGGCICHCDCSGIGESYCWANHCRSPGTCESCPC